MLHFFINTGIKDTAYYWNELNKAINLYCELKRYASPRQSEYRRGFPIQTHLDMVYDTNI